MRRWVGIAAVGLMFGAPSAFATVESPTVGSGHMQHCPTTVPGAKTQITEGKDAVEIVVTGSDAAKTGEIRKRAQHVVESAKVDPTKVEHDGSGHGGGGLGMCEIVLKDTTVTATDVDGGSKFVVKPLKPVDLEWLKKETHTRHVANSSTGKKKPTKSASSQ
jgi:hypothetical protein